VWNCQQHGKGNSMLNKKITKQQQIAIKRKYNQDNQNMSYLQFRRTVQHGYGCLMLRWCNMWLGIEPDGYTHS
jgi:hypothetical protein